MDLKLKIAEKKYANMSSLVKQMCNLKCRVKVDIEEGVVDITEIEEDKIENIINSINEAFNISGIDVIPKIEPPKPVITEDSIEFTKIEFKNEEVEEELNRLLRTAYWAIYSSKAQAYDIARYINAATHEIRMKYNSDEMTIFSIGDIVACNYGNHLKGEPSGRYVHSIVCNISEETVYVVPITKGKVVEDKNKHIPIKNNIDANYYDPKFGGGTVLLEKGRYIRAERIRSVVGIMRPNCFKKILELLPKAVEFPYENYEEIFNQRTGNVPNDDNMFEFEENEPVTTEEVFKELEETENIENIDSKEAVEESLEENEPVEKIKKTSTEEDVLAILGDSLKVVEEQETRLEDVIRKFMYASRIADEGTLLEKDDVIVLSFIAACKAEAKFNYAFTYGTIANEISEMLPEVDTAVIHKLLRSESKKWVEKYPKLKEKHPRVSMMVVLKIFVKKMKEVNKL